MSASNNSKSTFIQAHTQTNDVIYRTNMQNPARHGSGVHMFFLKEDNVLNTTPRIISRQGQKSVELFFYHNTPFWQNLYYPFSDDRSFKSAFSLWNAIESHFLMKSAKEFSVDAFMKCVPKNFELMFIPECKWSDLEHQLYLDETIKSRMDDALTNEDLRTNLDEKHFFDFVIDEDHLVDMVGLEMKQGLEAEKVIRSKNIKTILETCSFKNIGQLVGEIVGSGEDSDDIFKRMLLIIKKICYPCVHWFVSDYLKIQTEHTIRDHFRSRSLSLACRNFTLSSQAEFVTKGEKVDHISDFGSMSSSEKTMKAKHGITLFNSATRNPFMLLCFSNMWIFGRFFKSIYIEKGSDGKTKFETMVRNTDPQFNLNLGFRTTDSEHKVFSPFWMSIREPNFYIGGFFNLYSYSQNMVELFERFDKPELRGNYSGVKLFVAFDQNTEQHSMKRLVEITSPDAVRNMPEVASVAKDLINKTLIPPKEGQRRIECVNGVFTLLIRTTAGNTDRMIMQVDNYQLANKDDSGKADDDLAYYDEFGEISFCKLEKSPGFPREFADEFDDSN